jgi:Uma2 family endonuclease
MSTFVQSSTKLNYDDYAKIPQDGMRHEIIDGVHIVNAAPSTVHQHVSKRLQYQLYTKLELAGLGVLFNAPVDVQLSEFDVVQPDLVVVLNENVRKITPIKIKVAPNLVVEILSPSTSELDHTLKKELYERSGVQEYWIVDPFEQNIEQWILTDGKFSLAPTADPIVLTIAPGVSIAKETIW